MNDGCASPSQCRQTPPLLFLIDGCRGRGAYLEFPAVAAQLTLMDLWSQWRAEKLTGDDWIFTCP